MGIVDLENTAQALCCGRKGILAADETPQTLTKGFEAGLPPRKGVVRNLSEVKARRTKPVY
jgi:hypothetical protein